MNDEPPLRLLLPDDLEAVASLHALCFPRESWDRAALAAVLASPGAFGLAAGEPSAPVGFLLGRVAADEAEILSLGIAPEARRASLARRLVAASAALVQARGARRLFLEVAADNAAARALYLAFGFRILGRRQHYYRTGSDALVLGLDLDGDEAAQG